MIKHVLNKFGFVRIALVASVGFPLIFASSALAQNPPPPPPGAAPAGTSQVGAPSGSLQLLVLRKSSA